MRGLRDGSWNQTVLVILRLICNKKYVTGMVKLYNIGKIDGKTIQDLVRILQKKCCWNFCFFVKAEYIQNTVEPSGKI